MSRPMVRIHNVETDEVIDREMNDVEFAEWQEAQTLTAAKNQELIETEAKREFAISKLAALGLTPDDLKALGL